MSTQPNEAQVEKKWQTTANRDRCLRSMRLLVIQNFNLLPHDEEAYFRSIYPYWLDRINDGEKQAIAQALGSWNGTETTDEFPPDEIFDAERLSWYMYAALVTALWSNVEHTLNSCCSICADAGYVKIKKKPTFVDFVDYFLNKISSSDRFDITQYAEFKLTNAARILNNAFKHKNGLYHDCSAVKRDNFHIDNSLNKDLLSTLGIVKNSDAFKIDYAILSHKMLILACGGFCDKLSDQIKNLSMIASLPAT